MHSIFAVYGGTPTPIQSSADNSGTGEGAQRAVQLLSNPYACAKRSLVNQKAFWINPESFVNAPKGTWATSRRDQVRNPGYSAVDLSVFKTGNITERVRMQFRAEMYNIFNRVNYAPFRTTATSTSGLPTSTLGVINSTIGAYEGIPGIGPGEPFNTQFSAKILF